MVLVECESDRPAGKRQSFAVVGIGVAAFDIDQRGAPNEAGPAGDRGERAPVVGVNGPAGAANPLIVAAEPAVLTFGTHQPIPGELVIRAGLHTAEQSALMAVA